MAIVWRELLHNGYDSVTEMLTDMYHTQHMTLQQVADRLGVSKWAVARQMRLLGVEIRPKQLPPGNSGREIEPCRQCL